MYYIQGILKPEVKWTSTNLQNKQFNSIQIRIQFKQLKLTTSKSISYLVLSQEMIVLYAGA